jgi:hypothetical protein
MQLPATLSAPDLKLDDGETVLLVQPVLRRKGIFGNRYGHLYVTTHRLAFVKAVMSRVASAIASGKPMIAFPRATIVSSTKRPVRKQCALAIHDSDGRSETFMSDEPAIDKVLASLQR